MTGCGETIILNECETFYGFVESTQDALLIFEACNLGVLRRVKRRLAEEERKTCVRPGAVFVYDENESGIKRWTDGKEWSPSRILGNFLVYRELQKKISRREGGGPGGSGLPPELYGCELQVLGSTKGTFVFKNDGLIKKTISAVVGGSMHHLVCYCTRDIDPNLRLYPPGAYRELAGIAIRQEFVEAQNFRRPLKVVRYGANGMPERRSISTRGSVEEDEAFSPEEITVSSVCFQAGQNASATPAGSSSSTSGMTFGSGLDLPEEDFTLTELSSVNESGGLNIQDLQTGDLGMSALETSADRVGFSEIHQTVPDIASEVASQQAQSSDNRYQSWGTISDLSPLLFTIPPFTTGDGVHRRADTATKHVPLHCPALRNNRGITGYQGSSADTLSSLECFPSGLCLMPGPSSFHAAPGNLLAGLNWEDPSSEVMWQIPGGPPSLSRNALMGTDSAVGRSHFDANGFDPTGFGLDAAHESSGMPSASSLGVDEPDFMTHTTFDNMASHDAYTALWSVSEG